MLYRMRWVGGLALALALAPVLARADAKVEGGRADAKAKVEGTKARDESGRADGKVVGRVLPLVLDGLRWGMTRRQLEECVDRRIEVDAVEARKRARSTPALRDLEAQVAGQKASFRRSYVELSEGPDGFDTSPLVGEFSKGNGEALMRLPSAAGGRVWFFLIGDRLWKTYEEVPYAAGASGAVRSAAFEEALKRVRTSSGGRAPRVVPAAKTSSRPTPVHEWDDGTTHVRLWDRGAGFVALVHEERAMLERLPAVRKKVVRQPVPDSELSPQVSAVLRGAEKKGSARSKP